MPPPGAVWAANSLGSQPPAGLNKRTSLSRVPGLLVRGENGLQSMVLRLRFSPRCVVLPSLWRAALWDMIRQCTPSTGHANDDDKE